ncbi:DUF1080 domain-containing protein [Blastopirellula marina]|uniref:DUF1080 domain-containing protein n=1 Tax=Blastopirellula marina TaxID=124 RepID=A0A2S8F819_9BACT|nr:DUF1080 domain-containing protein [Blastopirellula marina]PQO28312.1 DUF1080 domain-containing protein [Blastopirellula marina]PTL41852.1 DUF1080 domain-containing protein [Blastopirellula marina]
MPFNRCYRTLKSLAVAILPLVLMTASLTTATYGQETPGLSPAEIEDGWISLFDGKSLYGWRVMTKTDWKVVDGTIEVTSGEIGLLCTTTQFADYLLRVDFQADEKTNSGVFLRTSPSPKSPTYDCYELNIAPPSNAYPTGSLVGRDKVTPECTPGEWHTFEIRCQGPLIEVKLDGEVVTTREDKDYLGKGFIGLQHNGGKVRFRNICLKPLGLKSIFNGKDLTGWKTYPEMDTEFTVTEAGEIHAKNGPGQLETEQAFANFVLQMQAKTNAENLNSGVFFRCIPGDKMMGYESQIHNGIEAEDPTKPLDSGTGAIFRRTVARRVVSQDNQWLTKTLIADGGHISVWVNGYQVTDWTDQRKPNENPRRGLRVEAGTIMLQGHDPTTDVSFRDIHIQELPARWPVQRTP